MVQSLTLKYWTDDGWYAGRLKGAPGVFSQGESLAELEDNIRDAYRMMIHEEGPPPSADAHTMEIEVLSP
jgi:predicted RNase H-like HicB family nuclease